MTDLVTVVLPTYYRNDSLTSAINSVRQQSYGPIEIIVIDDSGESHARPAVEPFDVTYIAHTENKGANQARNTGIEAANGKYVQLLDDDDTIFPEKIETQVALLQSSPGVGVVYGGVETRDGEEVYPDPECRGDPLKCALQLIYPGTFPSSMLISMDVLRDVYPLAQREAATDIGMKIELAQRTGFDHVDEILTTIGASESHLSESVAFATALENIIEEYDHLYDRYPQTVRDNAVSFTHQARGKRLLTDSLWSPAATLSFLKAVYYYRKPDPLGRDRLVIAASALASVFGRPGVTAAGWVRENVL